MKTDIRKAGLILSLILFITHSGFTQLNGFELTPSGNTEDYIKYIRKWVSVNETDYYTGYLTLSAFKNVTNNAYFNNDSPFQKLQIQGGNILLCSANGPGAITDINPTSRNGAILFSDWASDNNNYKHGKWGIEYDNQYSSGGLNIFKPVSSLTSSRVNYNIFIRNDGNVGIGSGDPVAKLQVKDGDIYIEDINRGIIMKSPDGNCWRGVLNNQGQLEFVLLPDCVTVSASSQELDEKPGFNIVPNPASGSLQIRCTTEDMTTFTSFKMLDSSGKEVKAGTLNQTSVQLDIQNLSAGIYFLQFYGKVAFWTEKVVIQ